jgi:hypothetical protein
VKEMLCMRVERKPQEDVCKYSILQTRRLDFTTASPCNPLLCVGKNIYHLLFNIQIRYILPTHCICVFHMILRTNGDHFREQHKPIDRPT